MKTSARFSTARNRASSGTAGKTGASGRDLFQFIRQGAFARAGGGGEGDGQTSRGGELIKFRPMPDRPLAVWLARSDVTKNCAAGQQLRRRRVQSRITLDFRFERAGRDIPRGKQAHHPRRLMLLAGFQHNALVIAKPAAQKSAALRPAEPLARADEKAQNRAAIVASKIHRAVKAFAAQRADDRPGLAQARASTPARHRPDAVKPGQMLENRRDFLRHEHVQFGVGEMFTERAERGREQHRVAKVFELDGEDFFGPRAHDENCSS